MTGEISFVPSQSDYVAANRDWFWLGLLSAPSLAWFGGLILFCAAIGAAGSLLDETPAPLELAFAFGFFGLILSLLIILFCFAIMPFRARRLYRQHKALQQLWRYSWTESGIKADSATGTATYAWSDLHRSLAARRNLLFFVNDQLFLFLPRRLLTPDQQTELIALSGGRHGR